MNDKTHSQLTSAVEKFLATLRDNRQSIVANYYSHKVTVGFDVDKRARNSVVTSANSQSPIDNVVSRLSED